MSDTGGNGPGGPDGPIDPGSPAGAGGGQGISGISITTEMERSFLGYAMSVIVSRALPDVRDGLKPVHRRILYTMHENGYEWNRPYKKSSRVVGDVMGKYHPHGDQAIYDALVRMAQPFSMRVPLVDGQGNFGSVDGDAPAAMRYTEVRLQKVTGALLADIDKDTVDFQDNYDGSEREPTVLPARIPNLLINGAGGIAVGMATNIPPHNLGEVIDATIALIDDPALAVVDLMEFVPGPDFPTGGQILGRSGIRSSYEMGRGSVLMRGKVRVEPMGREREALIVDEIPYQVNKATMVERIADLVREKRVEGISDLRDESDRDGMRVVIELKRDANADVVLNQLYRYSPLQTSFGCNIVALNGGRPEQLNLKDLLSAFIAFREEVVARRTKFLLAKARDRAHVLVGLAVAVANIDEVIRLIRTSPDPATARAALMDRDWPAHDMGPLIELIDDPRHKLSADGTIPPFRGAGARDPRSAPATPHRARDERDRRRVEEARRGDRRLSRHPALAPSHSGDHQGRAERGARRVRNAAAHRDPGGRSRPRGRGLHQPRGHGRDRVARRLHQAGAARHLPGAASRREGPCRDVDP